jgi:GTPase SAR1 family protein
VELDSQEEKAWLKESVCVILLFDITKAESFHAVIGRTLEEARKHVHESWSFFMLVGNKLDLEDSR